MSARALFVAALSVGVLAQPAARPQSPSGAFRSAVEYVTVPVVVTEHHDRPVTDLTATDFEIREHGRLQRIVECQRVSVPLGHRTFVETVARSDVAVNTAPAATARQFVVVIDDLHILESLIVPVKRLTTEFLQALSPTDAVAIVFVGRSDLGQDFTTDGSRLATAIAHVPEALGFGLDAGPYRRFMDAYRRSTVFVLGNVVASLAGSRYARRAVVYVSSGFATDVARDNELLAVFESARRADVPIYTIDPRGLVLPEDAIRGGIGAIGSSWARQAVQRVIVGQQNTLAEIAINTGGRAFLNRSSLTDAVSEMVTENGNYYLLGYYPDPLLRDGKFHDIDVKVKRSGVTIRARKGYLAPTAATAPDHEIGRSLDAALAAGSTVSDLPMRAIAQPMVWAGKAMATVVTVEGTYPAPLTKDDTLHLRLLALDADGKVRGAVAREVHVPAVPSNPDGATFLANTVVNLPPRASVLRIGVASIVEDAMGTVQIPVAVSSPSAATLQESGLLLGVGAPSRAALSDEGVFERLVPFQPTTRRTFAATDTLRIFARASWKSKETVVTGALTIKGAGVDLSQALNLTASVTDAGRQQAVVDITRSLAGLAPAEYVIDLSLALHDGRRVSQAVVVRIR
jgi:VWFA-related protein